jgi:hypothetical protein
MILRLDGKLILILVELTKTNVDLEKTFENFENAFEQDEIMEFYFLNTNFCI